MSNKEVFQEKNIDELANYIIEKLQGHCFVILIDTPVCCDQSILISNNHTTADTKRMLKEALSSYNDLSDEENIDSFNNN